MSAFMNNMVAHGHYTRLANVILQIFEGAGVLPNSESDKGWELDHFVAAQPGDTKVKLRARVLIRNQYEAGMYVEVPASLFDHALLIDVREHALALAKEPAIVK